MRGAFGRRLIYGLLVLAFVLHNDLWLWDDPTPLLGLPVGLTYHVLFCFAVAGILGLLVCFAWPAELEDR